MFAAIMCFRQLEPHRQPYRPVRASASEVHAVVEGAIRHGTTMTAEGNYCVAWTFSCMALSLDRRG
jgi:hypothetical protein